MARRPHFYTDQNLISKTNAHIAAIESCANAELERLRLEQVEHDKQIIAHWETQVRILNEELEVANKELRRLTKEVERLRGLKRPKLERG